MNCVIVPAADPATDARAVLDPAVNRVLEEGPADKAAEPIQRCSEDGKCECSDHDRRAERKGPIDKQPCAKVSKHQAEPRGVRGQSRLIEWLIHGWASWA